MLQTVSSLLAPPVLERLTLALNHVLGAEPAATARLLPHAGRTVMVALDGWPSLLPPAPPLAWRITPAGLLEWCGMAQAGASADLQLHVAADNPALLLARALGGQRPGLRIEGDAVLAADVNWLAENLRWDAAGDLERAFGPVVARPLHALGHGLAGALGAALAAAEPLARRFAPGGRAARTGVAGRRAGTGAAGGP